MNRILKAVSAVLILVGLGFVFFYLVSERTSAGTDILENPSYYIRQNYWYVFLAGAAVILFALLGSFFTWHKKMRPAEEVLLNAGFVAKEQIQDWVGGSSLDRTVEGGEASAARSGENGTQASEDGKAQILSEEERTVLASEEERTEIRLEEEKTQLMPEEERTVLMSEEERTVVMAGDAAGKTGGERI